MPRQKSGAGVTGHPFSYPCRFKKRDDGSYFIRFPDLPEAMVDLVEEADLYRSASECLASVLFWRITNEIEIPLPSRPRPGQHLIELGRVQALSEAIARGRRALVIADVVDAPSGAGNSRLIPRVIDSDLFHRREIHHRAGAVRAPNSDSGVPDTTSGSRRPRW